MGRLSLGLSTAVCAIGATGAQTANSPVRFDRLNASRLRTALLGHAIRREVPACCDNPNKDEAFFPSGVWSGWGSRGNVGKWYIRDRTICVSEKDPNAVAMLRPNCRGIWFDNYHGNFLMRTLDAMRYAPQVVSFAPLTLRDFAEEPKGWDLKPGGGHLSARRR